MTQLPGCWQVQMHNKYLTTLFSAFHVEFLQCVQLTDMNFPCSRSYTSCSAIP